MANDKQVDDLVAMLDQFVLSGGGHMNVEVEDNKNMENVDVQTRSSNCCQKNMACQVPTFLDEPNKEEEQN